MAAEYPYVYCHTYGEAVRQHETELWEPSFRESVCCARAIEMAIRHCDLSDGHLPDGIAAQVLEEYGHKRVRFVLAQTLKEDYENPMLKHLVDENAGRWAKENCFPLDKEYGRYYSIQTAIPLLNDFVRQTQEAYHAFGLFGQEHCSADMYKANVAGKVLVLAPDTLKESAWSPENQLWLATGGFGCEPKASGRAVFACRLYDGEETRWNREDFCGVLDEQYLPEWGKEKLEAIQSQHQSAQEMRGMIM